MQESIGRAKNHVVSLSSADNFLDVEGHFTKLVLRSPGILAGNVISNQQRPFFRFKNRLGIYLIVRRVSSQQFLVVLYGQQCGRKQNGTPPLQHAFLQIFPGIYAKQLHLEASVIIHLGILHIMLIHPLIHIQEM